mmetsp:Transcript_32085/g.47929  ORF Transcript_32085/g.47929 Transcript_32085/m.47929 type:complete len:82 (-) Transcript_32085:780-1025(-)
MFDKRKRNLGQKRAENQNFDTWKGNVLELKVTDEFLSMDEPSQRRQEMRHCIVDFFCYRSCSCNKCIMQTLRVTLSLILDH